jgi:hypothetical protein
MATTAETAVQSYLVALKDPSALRDDESLADLQRQLSEARDSLTRLRLQQRIMDAEEPKLEQYEAAFITHAKDWADENGISSKAFVAEGVDASVLRRAGFNVPGRGRATSAPRSRARTRSRVTTAEVRAAIPQGTFTVKQLQQRSGASPAVVRKAIQEEMSEGQVKEIGTDPDHRGPGRAPVLYERS